MTDVFTGAQSDQVSVLPPDVPLMGDKRENQLEKQVCIEFRWGRGDEGGHQLETSQFQKAPDSEFHLASLIKGTLPRWEWRGAFVVIVAAAAAANRESLCPSPSSYSVWWFGSRLGPAGVSGFHRLSVGGQLQLHQPSESRSAPPGHQPRHHHRTFTSVQLRLLGFSQSLRSGEHAPPVR